MQHQQEQAMKERTDQLDFIKIKIKIRIFCSVKGTVRISRQTSDRQKIFAKDISDKELLGIPWQSSG